MSNGPQKLCGKEEVERVVLGALDEVLRVAVKEMTEGAPMDHPHYLGVRGWIAAVRRSKQVVVEVITEHFAEEN